MRYANRVVLVLAIAMLAVWSQSAAAQEKGKSRSPGKEQVWDVDFLMGGEHYTGTMTLATSKGAVTGKVLIDAPTKIEGQVEGQQTGETLSLDFPYTMVAENCTGRVQIEAKFPPKAQEASGTAHAVDCNGQPTDGTVTFKKAADKPKTPTGF